MSPYPIGWDCTVILRVLNDLVFPCSTLHRVLEPSILMEMTVSDGRVQTFEVVLHTVNLSLCLKMGKQLLSVASYLFKALNTTLKVGQGHCLESGGGGRLAHWRGIVLPRLDHV